MFGTTQPKQSGYLLEYLDTLAHSESIGAVASLDRLQFDAESNHGLRAIHEFFYNTPSLSLHSHLDILTLQLFCVRIGIGYPYGYQVKKGGFGKVSTKQKLYIQKSVDTK